MKIYYLSGSVIPSRFANSVHVMKMCQAFAKNGQNVRLFAISPINNDNDDNIDVYKNYGVDRCFSLSAIKRSQLKHYRFFDYYRKIKNIIKENGLPDIFYSRDAYGLNNLVPANKKFIFETHQVPTSRLEAYIDFLIIKVVIRIYIN